MFHSGKWPVFECIHDVNSGVDCLKLIIVMKKSDIPQQPHEMYQGETKAVYAVNEDGRLEMSQTSGWDVESTVLEEAVNEINRLAVDALDRVHAGISSPLEYHMYAQRMDLLMLAQAVGRFQWQVKRHFEPKNFGKIKSSQLELYAHVLGIDVKILSDVPDE